MPFMHDHLATLVQELLTNLKAIKCPTKQTLVARQCMHIIFNAHNFKF